MHPVASRSAIALVLCVGIVACAILFFFAEYHAACCGSEGEENPAKPWRSKVEGFEEFRRYLAAKLRGASFSFVPSEIDTAQLSATFEPCTRYTEAEPRASCFQRVAADALSTHDGVTIMEELSRMSGRSCHDPGHALGRELVKRYGSIERALAHCSQLCS